MRGGPRGGFGVDKNLDGHREAAAPAVVPSGLRVLIVSDSLGTPIHPRGISHYTANLVRALRQCGHEVVLLIEKAPLHSVAARQCTELGALAPTALRAARLGMIYNYLARPEFTRNYLARPGLRRWLVKQFGLPSQAATLLRLSATASAVKLPFKLHLEIVRNEPALIDFTPARLDYLRWVSAFALHDGVYSLALATSMYSLGAATIDARGFDFVIVDTPTHLRFACSPGAEVVSVIHDLIPLSDPLMNSNWRNVFARMIACTVTEAHAFVYVSEYTKRRFAELFPDFARTKPGTVLYPSVAEDISHGTAADDGRAAFTSSGYFVAIISDEPRKNLAHLIEAFEFLPPDVTLKVIGHLDDTHYQPASVAARERIAGRGRIDLLGYTSEATKRSLLAGALGVVVPSYSEGFGIPLVEGAFFGKPVFCSDIPVFREVAGAGAFYFDPYSPRSIAAALRTYLAEPERFGERIGGANRDARDKFGISRLTEKVALRFGGALRVSPA